jgi:hypothetical protein
MGNVEAELFKDECDFDFVEVIPFASFIVFFLDSFVRKLFFHAKINKSYIRSREDII